MSTQRSTNLEKNIILDIKNLRTQFDTHDGVVNAVNGISYSLVEGEALGIVGESGCGKSVSMLSVMRLLPQPPATIQADSILFDNQELLDLSNNEMQDLRGSRVAMIFQDPMTSLNPVLTIGYQLKEPLKIHFNFNDDLAEERAMELLDLVGIPDASSRLDDYPHQFSGGMRQRAMIAMSLVCNPSLLIADEPTTALDVTIQAQIVDLVNRLRDHIGMALIWITHDLGVIAGLAERVIVMYAGFLVEEAQVEELYSNPRHPYTKALLRSLPSLDSTREDKLEIIDGMPPDLIKLPKGCPFAPRCGYTKDICRETLPPIETVALKHKMMCWVDIDTGELR
jgi:oligopeptide transport system ATP-binding protein